MTSTEQIKPSESGEPTLYVFNDETQIEVALDNPESLSLQVPADPFKPSENNGKVETLPNLAPLSDGSEGSVSSAESEETPFEADLRKNDEVPVGDAAIEEEKEYQEEESGDEGYFTPKEDETKQSSKRAPPKPESPSLQQALSTVSEKTTESKRIFNDSFDYVAAIKREFTSDPHVYKQFLSIMKKFHTQAATVPETVEEVCKLFVGHDDLILGFNSFLPKDAQIDLEKLKSSETVEEKLEEEQKEEQQISRSLEVVSEEKPADVAEEKVVPKEEEDTKEKVVANIVEKEVDVEEKAVVEVAKEEAVVEEKAVVEVAEEAIVEEKAVAEVAEEAIVEEKAVVEVAKEEAVVEEKAVVEVAEEAVFEEKAIVEAPEEETVVEAKAV
eukprot:CAMPEP_0194129104 /NCGR_PEP_ID=MMETSP0152-20130528/317_1 /TAXON_ID=1049557 /ORGANISM="Thalassiothrix antarctica, Strain L6-D1" /LENGTH=385 /DNA_ID=CAMNT_0038823187 /DNA_START=38 /DNA_END=1192 /DNA_ORIENTATION=+